MRNLVIYFSNGKCIDCELEKELVDEVIDTVSKGKHDNITLELDDKLFLIVCNKIEFIEVKDI